MIYKAHCHLARNAFTPKSGNTSDTQAMKSLFNSEHPEKVSQASARTRRKLNGVSVPAFQDFPQSRLQVERNRDRKRFGFSALGGGPCHRRWISVKINATNRDSGFIQSATGVQANHKASPHPAGLLFKGFQASGYLVIGELFFNGALCPFVANPKKGVSWNVFTTDSFIQSDRENLQIKNCCIAAWLHLVFVAKSMAPGAPFNILLGMDVLQFFRADFLFIQKESNRLPASNVSGSGVRVLAIVDQKFLNPVPPCGCLKVLIINFLCLVFCSQLPGLRSLSWVIVTEPGRNSFPLSVTFVFQVPEWRIGTFYQTCHVYHVYHGPQRISKIIRENRRK